MMARWRENQESGPAPHGSPSSTPEVLTRRIPADHKRRFERKKPLGGAGTCMHNDCILYHIYMLYT